ncbi:hypothetical protein SAMN04487926_103451 [Paraburkholderia steynii]|uniref:Uncharacterized protein n=1 Tax=Paraburkholderia steynii TaxID=1245441 RepID=A0A7Z7B521_9BURK|nr:hypothetical protein SAMN04487926_103451 [Paraburkholderia steynii]
MRGGHVRFLVRPCWARNRADTRVRASRASASGRWRSSNSAPLRKTGQPTHFCSVMHWSVDLKVMVCAQHNRSKFCWV